MLQKLEAQREWLKAEDTTIYGSKERSAYWTRAATLKKIIQSSYFVHWLLLQNKQKGEVERTKGLIRLHYNSR